MTLPPALTRPWVIAALFTALAAVVVACGSGGQTGHPAENERADQDFVVSGVTENGAPRPLVKGTEIRITLSRSGTVRITAGCNTMSGTFELEQNRLSVGSLATTEMGCDQARMDQDAWVAGLFAKPVQLLTGKDAAIISGGVVLSLAPAKDVHPDVSLRGTHWVLDTVIDGETASSVPSGQEGSLTINGGTVSLYDGCNHGSGAVEVDGQTLVFHDVKMSALPCPTTHAAVLGAYAAVFGGRATYEISEGNLRITSGGHGLGFHAVQAVR